MFTLMSSLTAGSLLLCSALDGLLRRYRHGNLADTVAYTDFDLSFLTHLSERAFSTKGIS